MKIWIDLANSPQVLVFKPIIQKLLQEGHEVHVTTRAYAQTVELANKLGIKHHLIGQHGGRNLLNLMREIALRSLQLMRWANGQHFQLAVSHNSYSQVVAARILGIPAVTLMDYEHQPLNHICFRLAKKVIVPEPFPLAQVRKYGAGKKVKFYPGIKEQIYLAHFSPDPNYLQRENLPTNKPLVVIRPPAPWTAYHRFENDLFDSLLKYLNEIDGVHFLFIPRIKSQKETINHLSSIHSAEKIYDGPNLLYHAALTISGGGTMNRESAVLGTPTYTIFKGKMGAVDDYLIKIGRMIQLENEDDFAKLDFTELPVKKPALENETLLSTISEEILSARSL